MIEPMAGSKYIMLSLYDYESYQYSIQLNPDDIGTVPTELATTQLDSPIHAGKKNNNNRWQNLLYGHNQQGTNFVIAVRLVNYCYTFLKKKNYYCYTDQFPRPTYRSSLF
jgi:hypothetical protein